MKLGRIGALVTMVVGVGAVAWLCLLVQERAALATERAAAQERRAADERDLAAAERRLRAEEAGAEKTRAAFELSRGKGEEKAEAKPRVSDGPALTMSDVIRKGSTVENKTEADRRWLASSRARLGSLYQPFFRARGLDEKQQEIFKDNVLRRDQQNEDLWQVAKERGYDPMEAAISKLRGQIFADYAEAQRAVLGEEGFKAMSEFDRTADLRERVSNLAGLAAVAGVAFEPGQAEALIRAMAESSDAYRKGGNAYTSTIDWAKLRAQLPAVLSEDQVRILTTMEPPGASGGLHHGEWNTVLNQVKKAEAAKQAQEAAGGSRGGG